MHPLAGAEEEVDDSRPGADQQGGKPGNEHRSATHEALLVVLAMRTQRPGGGTDDQPDQRKGQGPAVQSIHEVLEHLPTRKVPGVRADLDDSKFGEHTGYVEVHAWTITCPAVTDLARDIPGDCLATVQRPTHRAPAIGCPRATDAFPGDNRPADPTDRTDRDGEPDEALNMLLGTEVGEGDIDSIGPILDE